MEHSKKNKIMSLIALILVIASIFSFKTAIDWCKSGVETVISWVSDDDKKKPCISEDEITLNVGDNTILTIEHVTEKDMVRWESSNKRLATIDKDGKVQALKEGNVKITLNVNDKDVDVCQIKIKAKSEKLKTPKYKLSDEKITLEVNKTELLTLEGVEDISEIEWTSTDNSIVMVANGEVTAKQAGTAKISASIAGKSYECEVTVTPIDKSMEQEGVTIRIPGWNNSGTASLKLTDSSWKVEISTKGSVNKDLIRFASENPSIATVTPDGVVKPVGIGTTNITVSYDGIKQDTLLLTITEEKKK